MSYDLVLIKQKGFPINLETLKKEVELHTPLADQEIVFSDEPLGIDLSEFYVSEVKHGNDTKKAFKKYLKEKGIKQNLFDRLFNKVDRKLVSDFVKETDFFKGDTEDVLTVFLKENDPNKDVVINQLRVLASELDLQLFDPQIGNNI